MVDYGKDRKMIDYRKYRTLNRKERKYRMIIATIENTSKTSYIRSFSDNYRTSMTIEKSR